MSRARGKGSTVRALRAGVGMSGRNGGLLFCVWLVNLILASVFLWSVYGALHDSFGHSLVADRMAVGFDYRWYNEFQFANQGGPARSLAPSIIGVGAPLDNVERLLANGFLSVPKSLFGMMVLYLAASVLLSGGIVARFHQPGGRLRVGSFLADGLRLLPRFLFLTVLLIGAYYLIFRYPARYLGKFNDRVLLDVAYEPAALALGWWKLLLTAVLLGLVFMLVDYARIAVVVNGRLNPVRGLWDALAFIARRPASSAGLYLILNLMGISIIAVYGLAAALARGWTAWGMAAIFGLGQLLIIARIWLRLTAYSSQMALYKLPPEPAPVTPPADETVPKAPDAGRE